MLSGADITGIRPVVLIEAIAPTAALGQPAQESIDRLSQLIIGKEYQAQVLSTLTDGTFLVKVGDAVANMTLPSGTKAGNTLDLTLLATQPRPTFILGNAGASVGASASLSNTGRLIGNLLQLAQQGGTPTTVIGKAALVADPGASTPQIASALQDAVSFSGLFYESHVAQWATGTRSTADLLREPPAKLSNTSNTSLTDTGHSAPADVKTGDLGKLMLNVREWLGVSRSLPDLLHTSQAHDPATQSATQSAKQSASQASTDPVNKQQDVTGSDGIRLISLQLDTLEQRRIMWQGELYPGQPLQWEISDDTPEKSKEQPAPEPSWHSTVRFNLPALGAISATIRLTGEHLQIQVNAANAETAAALRTHGNLLEQALSAAGSTLDALSVKQDG